MGIDCDSLGTVIVYLKEGGTVELDHEQTVEACKMAMEQGKSMDEIIRETLYPGIRLMRLMF
ncbi:MAG: hypothetical protein QXN26_05995 [Thermoplasmataceae archaeon]